MIEYKTGKNRIYALAENGREVGEIVFEQKDHTTFAILHTDVAEDMGGKGIAKTLVQKAVELAQSKDQKIIPVCSFAKALFEENADYKKVEAEG